MDGKLVSIGTGIGRRKCYCCLISPGGKVSGRGQYQNATEGAAKTAGTMARKYMDRKGGC